MFKPVSCVVVAVLFIVQVSGAKDEGITFKPEWDSLSGDPKGWTNSTKTAVLRGVGAATGAYYLRLGMVPMAIAALLGFGLVGITWLHVFVGLGLLYAWKSKNRVAALVASWVLWCLYKGYSFIPF